MGDMNHLPPPAKVRCGKVRKWRSNRTPTPTFLWGVGCGAGARGPVGGGLVL